jgi:transcriptional regulator with XRE-family HTH domain
MISPHVRRLRLATELRTLRDAAGVTHDQLAKKIGESRPQISRLENGHVAPDQDLVIRILDALGVEGPVWHQIVAIAQDAATRGWWESKKTMGEHQALYANLEAGAATIREYQQNFIPGLLQTSEFTQSRLDAAWNGHYGSATASGIVDGRANRQRMLRRPDGPTYEVILDEVAVRRPSAPAEILRGQLRYMAEAAQAGQATVRVLPANALIEGFSLPDSSFSIYSYPDPGDPRVAAVEMATTDLVITDQDQTVRYVELYDRLSRAALQPEDSITYLIKAAKTLPDHHKDQA